MDGAPLTFHKVAAVPATPLPDAMYFVRPDPDGPMSIVVTSAAGEPVPLEPSGTLARYVEQFDVPLAQWIVNHNLGHKPAGITVLNSGSVEVEANIVHTSENQFVVNLSPPMSGLVVVQ